MSCTAVQCTRGRAWYRAWLCISTVRQRVYQTAPQSRGHCCWIIPLRAGESCRWTRAVTTWRPLTMGWWYWTWMPAKTSARSSANTTVTFSRSTTSLSPVSQLMLLLLASYFYIIYHCLQWNKWMLNEPLHSRQWFNRHSFHAGRQSVVWPPALSLVWSRMTAPVGYRQVIP